jgi:hypothetical protein
MARGWQRRVEIVETRRNEARQRKNRSDEKRAFKAMVHELLSLFERHGDVIQKRADQSWVIHVWTDSMPVPVDAPPKSGKRRGISNAINETPPIGKHETPPSGKINKAHPRRKDAVSEHQDELSAPRLCRSHFLNGKCEDRKKKCGCPNVHYSKQYTTLADALNSKTPANETLAMSEVAHPLALLEDAETSDPGAMEMIFYFSLKLMTPETSSQDEPTPLNELIVEALSNRSCSIASVTFLAINDILLFDRYRDGLVVSERNFLTSAIGVDNIRSRGQSIGGEAADDEEGLVFLPGSLLEYILMFLPDSAVASTSMVCRAWNKEIGKVSAFLWRHLLERRSWPLPEPSSEVQVNLEHAQMVLFREVFISHYTAARDIKAIGFGMTGLVVKKTIEEKECCFQSFNTRRGAPQQPNCCVALEVWSSHRIIVAYSHDCTLRLFDAVPRTGAEGEKLCRELVCQRVDPYKNTKRRSCRLVAMGLDDEFIGCLLRVKDDNRDGETFILTVLSRETFLVADNLGDEGTMHVIDIRNSVVNYLLSCDDVDHGLLSLTDFLSDEGDIEDVEVLVSQSISACGNGRFMVEVSVSVPTLELGDEDSDITMSLLFRKLFLFSASMGAIVWMGESNPTTQPLQPRHQDMTLTSIRTQDAIGSRTSCSHAAVSSSSPIIMSGSIFATGQIQNPISLEASEFVRNEMMEEGWYLRSMIQRPVVMTQTEIVCADTFVRDFENGEKMARSIVSFYPTEVQDPPPLYATLHLKGNIEVHRLSRIRDDHIVAVCRQYSLPQSVSLELDMLDGHWFGDTERRSVSAIAIVIHLSSRTEIKRVCLLDDLESQLEMDLATLNDLPLRISVEGATASAGVWWKGVIMTGQDVRSVADTSKETDCGQSILAKALKKKKKKIPRKVGVKCRGKHT